MKATKEQIIAEAKRRWGATPSADMATIEDFIIDVAREGWTPPEPVVDPDVLAYREWMKKIRTDPVVILDSDIDAGEYDSRLAGHAYLAGARMAREQEQERAQVLVEYVDALVNGFFLYADYRERARAALAIYRGEA